MAEKNQTSANLARMLGGISDERFAELYAQLNLTDEPNQADIDAEQRRILAEAAAEQRRQKRHGG